MSAKVRFSRNLVLTALQERMETLERIHGFKHGDGWAVVKNEPHETIVAFGRYDAFRDLLEDFGS
jgi:hypothetical protein